ncbi:MAG: hypothetical protein EON56_00945 [Alphaproteobacteria bacterium]|nr:MAG: hypothetical protein EON56_00945 [Alphaproteobacteria bacterium]
MIRLPLVICFMSLGAVAAIGADFAEGDFECLSDLAGPETYHGTMRVESGPSFGWLDPNTATVLKTVPLQVLGAGQVIFGLEFSEHIVPGSFYLTGFYNEDLYSYEVSIVTDDRHLDITCTFVY